MIWVSAIVFILVFLVLAGGYFLLAPGRTEKSEIKKRISLLGVRAMQKDVLPDVLRTELLSDVPMLNRVLARMNAAVRIDRRLKQADMKSGSERSSSLPRRFSPSELSPAGSSTGPPSSRSPSGRC